MLDILNHNQIEQVLEHQVIGRIGCHAEGKTYVVPISYAYDGKDIYAHTHEGLKIKIMRKNPMVCFEVDDTRNLADWKSVIAWGEFEELTEKEDCNYALQLLNSRVLPMATSMTIRLGDAWPFRSDHREIDGIFFRIRLQEKTGRCEKNVEVPKFNY
ncbi:MAG: pyridoxamine 5'-phosphate oxidase family protein [Bacteroidota bacterium]|nr:pyridoxamine 5'-phosphate oxidase family protein [Flavisolibacter sp.]MDQ3845918.1 pyridoxamine 5'-phosphate oxidase family protein [Bacteroidota bacterium]MBD0294262.1 pyridoxamine 5'-phosphate oxidase family protein [Flavisolibacter sp.]MBD0352584.1 pyridoxamine 5'-phosphate oxidase family protein [Flavisolibacter sp.]MBD0368738.1 pyridoxamine 5'-phosphate oxidase family protein [Flavisolibacter sp.]